MFRMNICLVDDDPLFSDYMARSLINKECNVTCFSSGVEILDKLDKMPDMVFVDVQMDYMNGIQTSRILKKKWPRLNIVLISSNESADYLLKQNNKYSISFEHKSKDLSRILEHLRAQRIKKMVKVFLLMITAGAILISGLWYYLV
jgi:CheY-like chemotaxis protein